MSYIRCSISRSRKIIRIMPSDPQTNTPAQILSESLWIVASMQAAPTSRRRDSTPRQNQPIRRAQRKYKAASKAAEKKITWATAMPPR